MVRIKENGTRMHQNKCESEKWRINTMVCHCSHLAIDSSISSEKNWMSSGNRRPFTKLRATRPLWSWAQALMLAGAFLELKVGLPNDLRPKGRRPTNANLGGWLGIARRLSDHNLTRCPGWGVRRGIICEPRWLIVKTLLLFSMASRGEGLRSLP